MEPRPLKSKPRLLVLASTYPRWAGDHEPGFVHELSKRLVDRYAVTVLCPSSAGAATEEILEQVEVIRFRYAPRRMESLVNNGGITTNLRRNRWKCVLVPSFIASFMLAMAKAILRLRPQIVHAHWVIPQGAIAALLLLVFGKSAKFVVTSHGADLYAWRRPPFNWIKRFAFSRAHEVAVVSRAMVREATALGVSSDRIHIAPMGVDLSERFTPGEAANRKKDELIFVGRFVEKKGLRYLLEAMPAVLKAFPAAHLTVVGFGPEEELRVEQANRLGLGDAVTFHGAASQKELPDLYRKANVFVAPFVQAADGDQEGLGLVLLEAIGCGCKVVTTGIPAVRDVFDEDVPGGYAEPGSGDSLAECIINTIATGVDLVGDSSGIARLKERFDWSAVAEFYADRIYQGGRDGCSDHMG